MLNSLILAASEGHETVVSMLIEAGANVNAATGAQKIKTPTVEKVSTSPTGACCMPRAVCHVSCAVSCSSPITPRPPSAAAAPTAHLFFVTQMARARRTLAS